MFLRSGGLEVESYTVILLQIVEYLSKFFIGRGQSAAALGYEFGGAAGVGGEFVNVTVV